LNILIGWEHEKENPLDLSSSLLSGSLSVIQISNDCLLFSAIDNSCSAYANNSGNI